MKVVPGKTGWIEIETDKVHTFEVELPRLALAFQQPLEEPIPGGSVTLSAQGYEETLPFGAATEASEGLQLGFQGADDPDAAYDATLAPDRGDPYPLFSGRQVDARQRQRQLPVVRSLARLRLDWETGIEDVPLEQRYVHVRLPGQEASTLFFTDAQGWLRLPPAEKGQEPGEVAWLEPAEAIHLAVVGKEPPGEEAPPLQEEKVALKKDLELGTHLLASVRKPPRLEIPIRLDPEGAGSRRCQAYLKGHEVRVRVDDREVPCGVLVDDGRLLVSFRAPVGPRQVTVSGNPAKHDDKPAPNSNLVFFAGRINVE